MFIILIGLYFDNGFVLYWDYEWLFGFNFIIVFFVESLKILVIVVDNVGCGFVIKIIDNIVVEF